MNLDNYPRLKQFMDEKGMTFEEAYKFLRSDSSESGELQRISE